MECKICQHTTQELFTSQVLYKYAVKYYQCPSCKFIQTEKPYWLDEAYSDAIAKLDLGYITRNIVYSQVTSSVIKLSFNRNKSFIDYGGGYGMFVRLMRDKGLDFYRQDLYCENLFTDNLDIADIKNTRSSKFELLTSFEVFEHLDDPIGELEKMFTYSDSILFSTTLQPNQTFKHANDWWYFVPETGQHISLFSKQSLQKISERFDCNMYSNSKDLHLLTKKSFKFNPPQLTSFIHKVIDKTLSRNFYNPRSLMKKDFNNMKEKLVQSNDYTRFS